MKVDRVIFALTILAAVAGVNSGAKAADGTKTSAERLGWPSGKRVVIFHADDIGMCYEAVPAMRAQRWGRIVAITSIKLLEVMLNATHYTDVQIAWAVGLHLTFVLSAVGLGVLDRLTRH